MLAVKNRKDIRYLVEEAKAAISIQAEKVSETWSGSYFN